MAEKETYEELKQRISELEKEAEKNAVQNEDEKYRILFQNSKDAILIVKNEKFADCNQATLDMLGYKNKNKLLQAHPSELSPATQPDGRESLTKANEMMDLALKNGSNRFEWDHIRANGEVFPVEVLLTTISNQEGNRVIHAIWRDITERKLAEEELQKSESQLQTIIKHSNEIFYIHDTNNVLTYVSPTSKAILGYYPEEMKKKWTELASDNPINLKGVEITEKAIKTGKRHKPYLFELKKKDGTFVLLEIDESPVKDAFGKVVAISGAARDVTLKKQTEDRLIKSEQRFRDLFNGISDLIYIQDFEGCFTSVNPAMCKALDHREDELIGRRASDFMKPEFVPAFKSEYLEPLKKHGHNEGTTIYFKKNSEKIYIEYRSVLVRPEDGEPFISGTGRDITEKILSERKVAKLQEQIIQSQKMESIATLTGGIAHDFNNILYIILGNTELALEEIPKGNPAYTKLEEIKSASLRASRIIKQLLNFTHKTDQKLEPIGAVTVIQNALNFLRSTIPATIEIRKHLTDDDMVILADPIQINMVMMNICANASLAMEATGGILEVIVEPATIKARSVKNFPDLIAGKYAKITISDQGPGIDPETIKRIFDPYFTTNEPGKSSGMGLSIVHGIVKNHNGAILVDSKLGKGTTITLLFPVVDAKPKVEIHTMDELTRGTETILFVDDEEPIRIMGKLMLKRLGYSVKTSRNPREALDLFQSKPDYFDLVITDMTMPGMTGAQLSEKLLEIRPDIPIILCTGHSSLINEAKAKKLGMAGYIMKPMSISRLAKSIRKVLDKGLKAES
ncbi:MAG: PAS domain S-box protein [Proteobacteria bacterium]|nr:PAS domain S-box protein [Pseudomonadota bacterium]